MKSPKAIFVTGIGTGIGKTVCSSVLCTAFDADYWKPIQAGDLSSTDTNFIEKNASLTDAHIWEERFALRYAMAPHKAAQLEGVELSVADLDLPELQNHCFIEGAGGCMVPLNDKETFIDFAKTYSLSTILVVKNYLGSINHTLLSLEVLKQRGIDVLGIVIMGSENKASEEAYINFSGVEILGRIDWSSNLDRFFIKDQAEKFKANLKKALF